MLNLISTILECSRVFSLPMTIMSWLVVFTYSAFVSGNIKYGLIAFIGVCFAHLAANILDDQCLFLTIHQEDGIRFAIACKDMFDD